MSPRDFIFYLEGFLESRKNLNEKEVEAIKKKLQTVFKKETPLYDFKVNDGSIYCKSVDKGDTKTVIC